MKKFNKLKLLKFFGLVTCRFNGETLEFEKSFKSRFQAFLCVFLTAMLGLKIYASKFWPQQDAIQLYIGSAYK